MKLDNLLEQKKSAILRGWFDVILDSYPAETAKFLKSQKDRFSNPVGQAILSGVEGIFGELRNGMNAERITPFLDNIVRVRAIQDFTASQAVAFVFLLKQVIRKQLEAELRENDLSPELYALDSRIDALGLLAFDIYMKCREKIYELKSDELRHRTFRLLKRAKIICEVEGPEPGLEDNNTDNVKRKEVDR
jgi:hypothetical protein